MFVRPPRGDKDLASLPVEAKALSANDGVIVAANGIRTAGIPDLARNIYVDQYR